MPIYSFAFKYSESVVLCLCPLTCSVYNLKIVLNKYKQNKANRCEFCHHDFSI